jgi:hypothetical protein
MISPPLTEAVAQARIDDLRRAAGARRGLHAEARRAQSAVIETRVTIRLALTCDEESLARLAALDSAEPPQRPVLIAEVDGQLLAALSLSNAAAIANPFHPTADLVDLLRARAQQLDSHGRTRRCGRLRSWARLCPPPSREPINATTQAS